MSRLALLPGPVARLVAHARRSDVAFTAAGIAYYAQISLLPASVLVFVAVSAVAGDTLAVSLLEATGDSLSPAGEQLIRDAVTSGAGRYEATAGGLVVLAWGVLRLFRGLNAAFASVYESDEGIVLHWRDSAVTGLAVAGAVSVAVAGGLALRWVGLSPGAAGQALAITAVLTVTLFPVYYLLPAADVTALEALPGAVVTAGGWVLLRTAFRLYLSYAGQYAVYGVLGALIVLVTWLYFASVILVAGAVVNVVVAGRDGE